MIFRNIKALVRQFPLSLVLNFFGLAAAVLAFMVITYQVKYENSFDKCHPTSDRIFRIDKSEAEGDFRNILPRGFAEDIIDCSPQIEAGCVFMPFIGKVDVSSAGTDNPIGYSRILNMVSEGFPEVFGLTMIEGTYHALDTPHSVIIPKSLADMMFPGKSAIGEVLNSNTPYVLNETKGQMTITGVYEDFPTNTQLDNGLYLSVGNYQVGSYGGANFICYLLLKDPQDSQNVADSFNSTWDFSKYQGWLTPIELTPFTDIYFLNEGRVYKSSSHAQFLLLIAIAILILIAATINFTNFYIALTPVRMKGINCRRVLGASNASIKLETIGESAFWAFLSCATAFLFFGPICSFLYSIGLIPQAFAITTYTDAFVTVIIATLLAGIVAGLLPSVYLTSVQPALALKGRFGLSKSGRILRMGLVCFQFVISFILFVYVLAIQNQSRYMKDFPCGFDKERIAVVDVGADLYASKGELIRDQLRSFSQIEDVAFASETIGSKDSYNTNSFDFGSGSASFSLIYCTYNFPTVLGLKTEDGIGFNESDEGRVLITENLKNYGAVITGNIKGFTNNVNITSLRKGNNDVAFFMDSKNILPKAYLRLADNYDRVEVARHIERVLKGIDPIYEHELHFYSSLSDTLYSGEERMRKEVWLFSLLAILLSLVGIWGQTMMDVRYRRKAIALKRVMGATESEVIQEGIIGYAKTIAACFIISVPISWIISNRYLSQFSQRTELAPIIFVFSLLAIGVLSLVVVYYHYRKGTRTNPSEILNTEE